MTYAKLPLPCVDYPFGYQDLNQVFDNHEDMQSVFEAEHSLETPSGSHAQPVAGEHRGRRFARSLLKFTPQSFAGGRAMSVDSIGPVMTSANSPSVGYVTVQVQNMTAWRAQACGYSSSSTRRFVSLNWSPTLPSGYPDTLVIKLNEGGVLADFPFSVLFWDPSP